MRVNVYATGKNNLNIPLMLNSKNEISQDAIYKYAMNIQANFPEVRNLQQLTQVISYYMGIDLTNEPNKLQIDSWLNRDSSIIYTQEGTPHKLESLPVFHQFLFHHAIPMAIYSKKDKTFEFNIPNIALEPDISSLDNYASFRIIPKSILKFDPDVQNCVATPLVLCAATTAKSEGTLTVIRARRRLNQNPVNRF